MHTEYATDTTRIVAIQSAWSDDGYGLDTDAQRHAVRSRYFEHIEESTFDPAALDWWESEGASAYGHDDDPCDMGARDEFPSIIELERCCDRDYYDCECTYEPVPSDVDGYTVEYGRAARLNRDDLVILALQWSALDDGWQRDKAESTLRSELGYFADWLMKLASEARKYWTEYVAHRTEFDAYSNAIDDLQWHVIYSQHYAQPRALSELWRTAHERMDMLMSGMEGHRFMRDHSYDLARSRVADMVREYDDITAWLAECEARL